MSRYIATFPAGCYEIIYRQLKAFSVNEVKILSHDSSSITIDTTLRKERLIEFRFFTNVYMILDKSKLASYKPFIQTNSFRLSASINGEPSSIDNRKKDLVESQIEEQLNIKANSDRRSTDFVLIRRTGQGEVLTLKLPRAKHKREELPKGALRPELANILLLVAGAKAKDTLLDPFAGYGSIPLEAVRGFGVKRILVAEKDPALARGLIGKGYQVVEGDAAKLDMIPEGSIDRIVTDPPWGIYDESGDLQTLYEQFLGAAHKVLKSRGVLTILSGREVLDQLLRDSRDFARVKTFSILVSGKKATIFKLQKKN